MDRMVRIFQFIFLCVAYAALADTGPEARFGAAYELEMQGRFAEALAQYQILLDSAGLGQGALSSRILYRMGACEKQAGRMDAARRVWQDLLRSLPANEPMALRVREALKQLERETERVRVGIRMVARASEKLEPAPVGRAWVLVGEWGNEPPVVADGEGRIRAERRGAGQLADGRPYVLVYAEHPERPQAAVAVIARDRADTDSEMELKTLFGMTGRVQDRDGAPVEGARVRALGLLATGGRGGAGEWVPVPVDHLIPPVLTDSNGMFAVTGLIPGIRYTFVAERAGYSLERGLVLDAGRGIAAGDGGRPVTAWVPSGAILLRPEARIALQGRVWDAEGPVTGALVSAWSLPPVVRALVTTNTDAEGAFAFVELRENLVTLRVIAGARGSRQLAGIKPMGQDVDLILGPNGGADGDEADIQADAAQKNSASPLPMNAGAWVGQVQWLRGVAPNGDAPREEDWRGKVVVLRFSSAYVEASLRRQFPGEESLLARLEAEWRSRGVACAWVLPQADAVAGGRALALEADGDFPVALDTAGVVWSAFHLPPQGGYGVMDRKGQVKFVRDGGQVFRLVKEAAAP